MGNQQASLGKADIKELRNTTKNKLSKKDIQRYHKFWYDLYPDGNMQREGLHRFAKLALPDAPEGINIDYLFRAMDQDKNGTVSFKEFLIFQSVTAPTLQPLRPEELIDLAFDMYDEDEDGMVSRQEMTDSLFNMLKANGEDTSQVEVQATIHQQVENLIQTADANKDGFLTREEILKACQKDPTLLAFF